MYSFQYHAPTSLAEADTLFTQADDPIYIAGGMTLIPSMKQRLAQPSDVIDLSAVEELRGVSVNPDFVVVGGLTTHNQVRNRGTLGGSLANSDPAADYPAAAVALGATLVTNRRRIHADDFFVDLFETALNPNEIILRGEFPVPQRATYAKFANQASGYAVVGVLVADFGDSIRVGVTGAGPCAFRACGMEQQLQADFSAEALANSEVPSAGFNSDLHASADYRAHLVRVMGQRAVQKLLEVTL